MLQFVVSWATVNEKNNVNCKHPGNQERELDDMWAHISGAAVDMSMAYVLHTPSESQKTACNAAFCATVVTCTIFL